MFRTPSSFWTHATSPAAGFDTKLSGKGAERISSMENLPCPRSSETAKRERNVSRSRDNLGSRRRRRKDITFSMGAPSQVKRRDDISGPGSGDWLGGIPRGLYHTHEVGYLDRAVTNDLSKLRIE
jgi:hypothetical protein